MIEKKMLIIAPNVFNIMAPVLEFYQKNGYTVFFQDDRHNQGFVKNIILRFFRQAYFKIYSRTISRSIADLDEIFDKVIVINGEGYDLKHLEEIHIKAKRISFYSWDSVSNKRYLADFYSVFARSFDFVGTFDKIDADQFHIIYKPLFANNLTTVSTRNAYEMSFVGTMHSQRLQFLAIYLSDITEVDADFYIALYCKNWAIYVYHFFRNFKYFSLFVKYVKVGQLPSIEFDRILSESKLVLDYCHPNQAGLTHRFVTALSSGKTVLTNNPHMEGAKLIRLNGIEFFRIDSTAMHREKFTIQAWADNL